MTAFAPPVMPGAPKPLPGQTDTIARFDLSAPLHPAQGMDPSSLTPEQWAHVAGADGKMRDLLDVATVIGSAYAVFVWLNGGSFMLHGVRAVTTPSKEHLTNVVTGLGQKYRTAFTDMVLPALRYTITAGTTGDLSYEDKVVVAQTMSHQIFDYVNDSSAKALVDAYNNQLAQKWSPEVAWARVAPAYGLEPRSMNQYLKLLAQGEGREILPTVAKDFAARAIQARAERIGATEAYRAHEMGKTIVWLSEYRKGALPKDVQRKWRTAADEKVCSICGPMDLIQVPMTEQFELPDGNKVWAPGVHPNCRCSVELSYPEFDSHTIKKRTSTYDPDEPRNADGEWTRVGTLEREAEQEPASAPAPTVAPTLSLGAAPTAAPTLAPAPVAETLAMPTVAPTLALPAATTLSAPAPTLTAAAPTLSLAPAETLAPWLAPTLALAPVKADEDEDTGTPEYDRRDWFVLANDYTESDPDDDNEYPWGVEDGYEDENGDWVKRSMPALEDRYELGDEVDFDGLKSENGSLASPLYDNLDPVNQAGTRYADNDSEAVTNWALDNRDGYLRAAHAFYKRVTDPSKVGELARSLTHSQLAEIYRSGGDRRTPRILDDPLTLQRDATMRLTHPDAYPGFTYSWVHWFEQNRPSSELEEYRDLMDAADIRPHNVQVFRISHDRNIGEYRPDPSDSTRDKVRVSGKYQIAGREVIPLKHPDFSSAGVMGLYPDIDSVEFLYLDPLEPSQQNNLPNRFSD